jgi:hypothetical protein
MIVAAILLVVTADFSQPVQSQTPDLSMSAAQSPPR